MVMFADCLTKAMRDDLLVNVVSSDLWGFGQIHEAKRAKQRQHMQRGKHHLACGGVADSEVEQAAPWTTARIRGDFASDAGVVDARHTGFIWSRKGGVC